MQTMHKFYNTWKNFKNCIQSNWYLQLGERFGTNSEEGKLGEYNQKSCDEFKLQKFIGNSCRNKSTKGEGDEKTNINSSNRLQEIMD